MYQLIIWLLAETGKMSRHQSFKAVFFVAWFGSKIRHQSQLEVS